MGRPDVSVIVIVYNDAARLPTAVESVRRQTLRNLEIIIVNDASTDDTADVAEALAAQDPRISVVHLPENSGGCSRPRNVGLEHAAAPYVMFLDSDDEYERHACKNLLYAAERNDADIAAGRCVRWHLDTDKQTSWAAPLYEKHAVYESIKDEPEQLWDTLSTNKLYRRAFLDDCDLRFVEGIHYEDLLFITEAYCVARRIAVIRNVVYYWKIDRAAERPSITGQVREVSNFQQRIDVHRRIKRYLRSHGHADLEEVVDQKFLRHDLAIYANQLGDATPEYQQAVLELGAGYLEHVSPNAYEQVSTIQRVRAFFISQRDLEETLKATRYKERGGRLVMDLHRVGDRLYFTDKYVDTEFGRRMTDVTDWDALTRGFPSLRLYNHLTELRGNEREITLQGRIKDPAQLIPEQIDSSSLYLLGTIVERRVPAEVQRDATGINWSATIDLRSVFGGAAAEEDSWRVGFALDTPLGPNVAALYAADVEGVQVRPRRTARTLCTGITDRGNLVFEMSDPDRSQQQPAVWSRLPLSRLRRGASTPLQSARLKNRMYRHVFQRLPIRRGLVVFESHMGRQYSDSPRYIYEALARSAVAHHAVWSYADVAEKFPAAASLVRRNSWRHYWTLARAEYWVDNQGLPRHFTKRPGTTYIQTWHGTPFKKMGTDVREFRDLPARARRAFHAGVNRWDYLVVQNEHTVNTLVPAFGFEGTVLRTGYPRNDLLVNGVEPGELERIRAKLGIPPDRKVVLYAPTFRDYRRRQGKKFKMKLRLGQLQAELQDEYYFLLRTHYLDRYRMPARHYEFAQDVSSYDDITELLLVADVLITDYSSVMFDYANLRRPMIFYAYDYDRYASRARGVYFDLRTVAPGPVVDSTDAVIERLQDLSWHTREFAQPYDAFVRDFCEYDVGKASDAIVEQFFARRR